MKNKIKYILLGASLIVAGPAHSKKYAVNAVPNEYIVMLKNSNAEIFSRGLKSQLKINGVMTPIVAEKNIFKFKTSAALTQKQLAEIRNENQVKIVEPNYLYELSKTPNDASFVEQWGLAASGASLKGIEAEKAWDVTTGNSEVIVAVVDTGVDYTHPDLKNNIWSNKAEMFGVEGFDDDGNGLIDDVRGYDFSDNDNDPFDDIYHGTHVAGIIGAEGNNEIGIAGVNWNVKLMPLKIFKPNAGAALENTIRALEYAEKKGARVINASWGGGARSQIMEYQISQLANKGILFVAAAGNAGGNSDINPYYPATYKLSNVISVAALDKNQHLADFSNYGARNVHIAAPGVKILSTLPNGKYGNLSGTSMATPFVTGVAALIWSHEPNATLEDVRRRLLKRGSKLIALKEKVVTASVLNAEGALKDQKPPAELDPDDPELWKQAPFSLKTPSPLENSSRWSQTFVVPGAKRVAIHFKKFNLEEGFDLLKIRDGKSNTVSVVTGELEDSYSAIIDGSIIELEVKTDESNTSLGFEIDRVGYEIE